MTLILPCAIGVLFGAGFHLMMARNLVRVTLGVLLLAQGTNLLVFTAGGIVRDAVPLIPASADQLGHAPDPLTQALILTAIVIGFALTAFLTTLARRGYEELGTDDPDGMGASE